MKLPQFSVRRPVTTVMAYLAIVVLSVVALAKLSLDILPEITFPALTVTTTYQGAGPEDIENKITTVIESSLGVVPDLKEIHSSSVENMSTVRLLFDWGTNLDEVANDVRTRLEFAKHSLPEEAETPVLLKFDMSQMPIMFMSVSARESYPDLVSILEDRIAEPLKRISGIGNVIVIGGMERQVRVDVDRQRLKAYHLSLSRVTQALRAHNVTQPAGDLDVGGQSFFLRMPAEFRNVREIGRTLVGYAEGKPVYLEDVAKVEDGFADPMMITRQETDRSALIIVQKRSGANTVKVSDGVVSMLEQLKTRLPKDVNLQIAMDSADDVKETIGSLSSSVLLGGLLVILVTYIFLANFRSSVVILVTIPISLIVAFLFLYLMGYTINIMSLSSMAIAIGMVVDNAIVVLENIVRRHEVVGEDRKTAAINGAGEVGMAVTASTLTTVVIFLPLIFAEGIVGILFKQLGSVISLTLLISLAISLTLSPMIASIILPRRGERKARFALLDRSEKLFDGILNRLRDLLQEILTYAFDHRKTVIAASVLILVLSLGLFRFIGTEFMPEQDAGFVQATIELPVNTPVEVSDRFALKLVREAQEEMRDEKSLIFTRSGQSSFGGGFRESGANIIAFQASLVDKDERKRSDKEIAQALRERFQRIPGPVQIDFQTGDPMAQQMGGGKPLSVEITGHDFAVTDSLAQRIKGIMDRTPGAVDASISRERGKLEYQFEIDRPKLAALGISPQLAADTLNIAFGGRTASRFREGKDEYDIFVRLRPEDRQSVEDILRLTVHTQDGRAFPMGDLVDRRLAQGPLTIERKDQQRIVTVSANVYGRSLGEVTADIEDELEKIPVPFGVDVSFSGSVKEQREAFGSLALAFLLGAFLTYMVMASQFESFRDPFIIMFAVPFALVGVLWGLFLTGQTFNVVSFIGLVMLVGIVVNNAIVYVDYTIQLRARGMAVREALLEAARTRLRPILMTTTTTIFGMLPLALSVGQGSETWKPLAVSVIGGLSVSTLITLVLVPVIYDLFEEKLKKNKAA